MKIVFVLPTSGRAGAVRSTVRIANELVKRGHEVRTLYREAPWTLRHWCYSMLMRLWYRGRSDWIDSFEGPHRGFKDINECTFAGYEVVVGVGSWAAIQVWSIRARVKAKVHNMHGALPETDRYLTEALNLPIRKMVVASYLVEFVRRTSGQDVIGVAPNGVDPTEYYPDGDEAARDGVGGIWATTKAKDPGTFLSVFDRLSREMPDVPQYVFSTYPRPKELARVQYQRLPKVDEARRLYSRAKVWIVPSASEGFGLPILEAMACGCAVVSTDCGGPRDMIEDGVNGLLVPVGDVDAIVEAAKRLLGDEDLRRRIAAAGVKTAADYTWEKAAEKYEQCLLRAAALSEKTPTGRGPA